MPMGRLSDILGRKRIYLTGYTIFVIGAGLAVVSPNVTILILIRILMGIGIAMTQGPSMAMMVSAFPENERGKALGLQMTAVGSGAVAGPALGGIIVSAFGWRGVFFATGALGLVTVVAASLILQPDQKSRGEAKAPFDWPGATFSAGFLVLFLLAMSFGPKIGWDSPFVIGAFAGAVTLIALFVWWELRAPTPMLEMKYFKYRVFTINVILRFIMFTGMSSARYLLPFYFQSIMGFSPRTYGLIAIPASLCTIIISPIAGRLSDRYGHRVFTTGGLIVANLGLILLAFVSAETALILVIGAWIVHRIGHGAFSAPNNASILSVVEIEKFGVIASFANMLRNAGNVTGTALATAIVTSVLVSRGLPPSLEIQSSAADAYLAKAFTTGMMIAYIVPAILIYLVLLLSFLPKHRTKSISN